jgi:hypothetical protein
MLRLKRASVRVLRRLTLKNLMAVASLAKTVIDIVRTLTGHN